MFDEEEEFFFDESNELPAFVDLSEEETIFLSSLASFYKELTIDGMTVERKQGPVSLKGLRAFEKGQIVIDGVTVFVCLSAQGFPELKIENMSVLSKVVESVSGSGKRLATEWWEIPEGYETMFIHIESLAEGKMCHNFAVYCDGIDYRLIPCSCFLREGATLDGKVLWIREEARDVRFSGMEIEVKPVKKRNFGKPIPDGISGIMVVVEGRIYRLRSKQTLDLLVVDGIAYNLEGGAELHVLEQGIQDNMIYEFGLDSSIVRIRPDKKKPDNRAKCNRLRKLPILEDLRKLLKGAWLMSGGYFSSQWVGYEEIKVIGRLGGGDIIHMSRNKLRQVMMEDHRQYYLDYQFPTPISLSGLMDEKGFFDYPSFVNRAKRSGYSFKYEDLRRILIQKGFYPFYDKYRKVYGAFINDAIVPKSYVKICGFHQGLQDEYLVRPPQHCTVLYGKEIFGDFARILCGVYRNDNNFNLEKKINRKYEFKNISLWKSYGRLSIVPRHNLLLKLQYMIIYLLFGARSSLTAHELWVRFNELVPMIHEYYQIIVGSLVVDQILVRRGMEYDLPPMMEIQGTCLEYNELVKVWPSGQDYGLYIRVYPNGQKRLFRMVNYASLAATTITYDWESKGFLVVPER